MSAATSQPLAHPSTVDGKRNWAYSAVHPGETFENRYALPEVEGSFADLIDVINPLQHIPVVGQIYRAITGDSMGTPANILGSIIFGGPVGFLASIGSTLLAQITGGDAGDQLLASLTGSSGAVSATEVSARYSGASRLADTFSDKNVIKI